VIADPLEYLFSLEHFGIKFGLDNIRALVHALDHPERSFRSVHVAGTNGKGSVAAMIDAGLREAGIRSGRYTSPHIRDIVERFVVDGRPIDKPALAETIQMLRETIDRLRGDGTLEVQPTFFEVTTAAAFELFRRNHVEVAVCEVGLGGRLDATNVLHPDVTAITSIALDHQQYLGDSLHQIAEEKAGIIKRGIPVVVGPVDREAAAAIRRIAELAEAPVIDARENAVAQWVRCADSESRTEPAARNRVRLRTPLHDYGAVPFALDGDHQLDNALVAVRVLETFAGQDHRVTPEAIARGLARVSWPGRLERVVLKDGREALLDAAHNQAGAAALASYLSTGERRPLVFAAMRDKDAEGILRALLPVVSSVVITRASTPRSADPAALAAVATRVSPAVEVRIVERPADALVAAWQRSPTIVVAGSIFLLGDVAEALDGS
jgi:dihydrofolate synthase/folylpolyglutamate synthase